MGDRLGEGAQYFLDNPTVCFLTCRSAAEALNGTADASHPSQTVRLLTGCLCFFHALCRTLLIGVSAGVMTTSWLVLLQVSNPPFSISNGNARVPLGQNTVAMSVSHHDGSLQYDTHNLYGLQVCVQLTIQDAHDLLTVLYFLNYHASVGGLFVQEVAVSHRVLPGITGKRPFILTR
jgi:hypothetical protein